MAEENIFNTLPEYNTAKWEVSGSREFNATERSIIKSAHVVSSDYGKSVCFLMVNNKNQYLPLSNRSTLGIGEEVDLNKAKLITLSKEGEKDIKRVEA